MPSSSKILQANCPGCQKTLRIPEDYLGRSIRCKHCNQILQLNAKPANASGQPAAEFQELGAAGPAYIPRKSGNAGMWMLSGILMLGTAGIALLIIKPEVFSSKLKQDNTVVLNKDAEPEEKSKAAPSTPTTTPTTPNAPTTTPSTAPPKNELAINTGIFPRRLLVINVCNYIYANPIHSGEGPIRRETDRRDIDYIASKLSDRWKIPKDQVYEVSDAPGPNSKNTVLPLKDIIVKTLEQFLSSSRAQDRIMIVFCGHAVEKEGIVYLAPLEADFEEPASMIPLSQVYSLLAKCPAQEKVIAFDVCRKNSKLGAERPTFGAMTEAMEKAFHTPPAGTSVWTACSAEQFSYELNGENYGADTSTFVNGSVFLNLFISADYKGKIAIREVNKNNPKAGGIQVPEDPLPLSTLEEFVKQEAQTAAKAMEDTPQIPKLTRAAATSNIAYNSAEPLPPRFKIPTPKATASTKEVAAIFGELNLPPIKSTNTKLGRSYDTVIPFKSEDLVPYLPDQATTKEDEDKSKYPIRAAVLDAIKQIREFQSKQRQQLPTELRENINDTLKKRLTNLQRPLADAEALFRDLNRQFTKLKDKKSEEKSKRWQAHFDYVFAQINLRLAYFGEYNKALSLVKTDNLDTSGAKHGFLLGSVSKMSATKDIRDFAEEGKTMLEQVVKDYPGTPWSVLAKRDRYISLGLKWVPIRLPGDSEEKPEKKK